MTTPVPAAAESSPEPVRPNTPPPPRARRGGLGPVTVLLALLVAAGGLVGFYLVEHLPVAEALATTQLALDDEARARAALEERAEALTAERDRLNQRVGDLRTAEEDLRRERDRLRNESETLRLGNEQAQAALAAMQEAQAALRERLSSELASGEIELRGGGASELSVAVGDSILFAPGHAELNPRGQEVLERVIASLGSLPDRRIRVEGHTDATPLTGENAERFPTNWELSTARATTVVRFLESHGIAGERLVAVGHGPHRAVADNDSARGRRRNRRIEIVLERETP